MSNYSQILDSSHKIKRESWVNQILSNVDTNSTQELEDGEINISHSFKEVTAKKNYPIFFIKSHLSLSKIRERIESFIPAEIKRDPNFNIDNYIGPLRVMRAHGEESVKTLCVMDRLIFSEMVKSGLNERSFCSDFVIYEYVINQDQLPLYPGQRHLFLHLPQKLTIPVVTKQLNDFLERLSKFNIFEKINGFNPYHIIIPFVDRELGTHIGKAHIIWDDSIDIMDIAMVRQLLYDTYWVDENNNFLENKYKLRKCHWSKVIDVSKIRISPADRSSYNPRNRSEKSKTSKRKKSVAYQGEKRLRISELDIFRLTDDFVDAARNRDIRTLEWFRNSKVFNEILDDLDLERVFEILIDKSLFDVMDWFMHNICMDDYFTKIFFEGSLRSSYYGDIIMLDWLYEHRYYISENKINMKQLVYRNLQIAAEYGYLRVFQWWNEHFYRETAIIISRELEIFQTAAANGHLNILQYIDSIYGLRDSYILLEVRRIAKEYGHYHIFNWINERLG